MCDSFATLFFFFFFFLGGGGGGGGGYAIYIYSVSARQQMISVVLL